MEIETRGLLINSIKQFNESDAPEKKVLIKNIKELLNAHQYSVDMIGMGYSDVYVHGARIFLRYIKLYKLI